MTQPKCAAQFAAETAALRGITSVTLVASGFLALVASGFLALVASGFLALVASGFLALVASGFLALVASGFLALVASGFLALVASGLILRGCRRLDVRRGSNLRRFGPRGPRFRGRGWPIACRTRLFSHVYYATGYPLGARDHSGSARSKVNPVVATGPAPAGSPPGRVWRVRAPAAAAGGGGVRPVRGGTGPAPP